QGAEALPSPLVQSSEAEVFGVHLPGPNALRARLILEQALDTVNAAHAFLAEERAWGGPQIAQVRALAGEPGSHKRPELAAAIHRLVSMPLPELDGQGPLPENIACVEAAAALLGAGALL